MEGGYVGRVWGEAEMAFGSCDFGVVEGFEGPRPTKHPYGGSGGRERMYRADLLVSGKTRKTCQAASFERSSWSVYRGASLRYAVNASPRSREASSPVDILSRYADA